MRIGFLGVAHLHAWTYMDVLKTIPDVELVVVAEPDAALGEKAAQQAGAPWTPSPDEALRRGLDAVIVASENAHHPRWVEAAAAEGVAILCEKPLATDEDGARRMVDACRRAGVILQTAFPMRYSTPVQRARDTVRSGALGRLGAMRGTNRGRNPGGWFVDPALSGGGAVLDHTVHIIDLMRWFADSEVAEVYAEIDTRFGDLRVDDCGILILQFANGVTATHDPSWSRPASFPAWGDVTLECIGTDGSVAVDAQAQHLHWYQSSAGLRHVPWGDDPDRRMIEDFVRCVREGGAPLASGEDGLAATKVSLAAYESARLGRPVSLG